MPEVRQSKVTRCESGSCPECGARLLPGGDCYWIAREQLTFNREVYCSSYCARRAMVRGERREGGAL